MIHANVNEYLKKRVAMGVIRHYHMFVDNSLTVILRASLSDTSPDLHSIHYAIARLVPCDIATEIFYTDESYRDRLREYEPLVHPIVKEPVKPQVLPSTKQCIRCQREYEPTDGLPDGAVCPYCWWPRMRPVIEKKPEPALPVPLRSHMAEEARRRARFWTIGYRNNSAIEQCRAVIRMHESGQFPKNQEEIDLHRKLIESLTGATSAMMDVANYLNNVAR